MLGRQRSAMLMVRNGGKMMSPCVRKRLQVMPVLRCRDLLQVLQAVFVRDLLLMVLAAGLGAGVRMLLVLRFRNLNHVVVMSLCCKFRQMLMMLRRCDLLESLLMVRRGDFRQVPVVAAGRCDLFRMMLCGELRSMGVSLRSGSFHQVILMLGARNGFGMPVTI